MNLLITGASGFIGREVCIQLKNKGHNVIGLYNKYRINLNGIKFLKCDITKEEELSRIFSNNKIDLIVHLAANIPAKDDEEKNPLFFMKTNVIGTMLLLEYARRFGVKKFIYTSTMSVFDFTNHPNAKETDPIKPLSIYGLSKYEGELYCKFYSDNYKMNVTVLRLSNVFGTGKKSGAVYNFIKNSIEGKDLIVSGTGNQTYDFVYVKDVAEAIYLVIEKCVKGFEIFHIGSGKEIKLNQLAKIIQEKIFEKLNKRPNIIYQGKTSPTRFCFSIKKAQKILTFKPQNIEDSINEMIDHAIGNNKNLFS
jgi:UDP-glucose 4-epimerase